MKRNRPFILTGLALMALVGLVVVARPAPASPPSVDNVVNVIRANIEAGKWSLAARNIEALDRTIYDELQVKNRPVVIDSNPVQDRLGEVAQRLQLLKADYRILDDAQSRIDRASVRRANVLTVQIGIELVKKLNLIKPEKSSMPLMPSTETAPGGSRPPSGTCVAGTRRSSTSGACSATCVPRSRSRSRSGPS